MMLTIGLIDNYAMIRNAIGSLISNHFRNAKSFEANSLAEFTQLHPGVVPDLFITGFNGGGKQECFQTISRAALTYPSTRLIVYDDIQKENNLAAYLQMGVSGYISKQNSFSEMVRCIEAVLEGKKYLCPILRESLLQDFFNPRIIAAKRPEVKLLALTTREAEIADYLSQGMKTSWIAKTLDRKPSTISTIKLKIFMKMKVNNVIELQKVLHA